MSLRDRLLQFMRAVVDEVDDSRIDWAIERMEDVCECDSCIGETIDELLAIEGDVSQIAPEFAGRSNKPPLALADEPLSDRQRVEIAARFAGNMGRWYATGNHGRLLSRNLEERMAVVPEFVDILCQGIPQSRELAEHWRTTLLT